MSSSRVYVGRLSYQAREKDVERIFRGFGRIKDINLKNGFGFVVRQKLLYISATFRLLCLYLRNLTTQRMQMTLLASAMAEKFREKGS